MIPKKRVAIIGAGPAGLVAAKEAIEHGLEPVVFEKHAELGGLWHPETGSTWHGLRTNLSKLTSAFPAFPWPENASEFPTQQEMYEYLHNYAKKYELRGYIKFNCTVQLIQQNVNKWLITADNVSEEFEFVIIASGIFSTPYMPFEQSGVHTNSNIEYTVMHSSEYKNPNAIMDKDVLVFGGGFSGVDIATTIAKHARHVVHVIRTPYWIIPRYIDGKPLDKVLYDQSNRYNPHENLFKTAEENIKTNAYMATLSPMQATDSSSALYIEPVKNSSPAKVAISDEYMNLVKTGKIVVKKTPITNHHCNFIIYCTGYRLNLNFLHNNILNALKFENDQLQPILLHKCTWHPKLPGMAFVGMYRGPYFPIMELQSKWAAKVFSKELTLPQDTVMHTSIAEEQKIRALPKSKRPQFPHGDYVGLRNDLTTEVNRKPNILYGYRFSTNKTKLAAVVAVGIASLGLGMAINKYAHKF